MKEKICILYTGGTIGMVATENGYAPKENYLSELLSEITELKNPAMPSWDVIEFSPLLDSLQRDCPAMVRHRRRDCSPL